MCFLNKDSAFVRSIFFSVQLALSIHRKIVVRLQTQDLNLTHSNGAQLKNCIGMKSFADTYEKNYLSKFFKLFK